MGCAGLSANRGLTLRTDHLIHRSMIRCRYRYRKQPVPSPCDAVMLRSIALLSLLLTTPAWAGPPLPSCYAGLYLGEPARTTTRTYYLFVDQTTPLTDALKTNIAELTANWGADGEHVKIVRFSANVSGQYTELMFDEFSDPPPPQEYLFHLRADDQQKLLACIKTRDDMFHKLLNHAVSQTLILSNGKLPKTDLLYALKELTMKVLAPETNYDQTVLLVSDGLENSSYASFYQRKTTIKPIDVQKTLEEISKYNLIPNWHGAKVYMFGLGYLRDEKIYANPKMLQPLKDFWQSYFSLGKAQLMELGTPELLVSRLK